MVCRRSRSIETKPEMCTSFPQFASILVVWWRGIRLNKRGTVPVMDRVIVLLGEFIRGRLTVIYLRSNSNLATKKHIKARKPAFFPYLRLFVAGIKLPFDQSRG